MVTSRDNYIPVPTDPKRILERDPARYSWHITNIGTVPVYYLRGDRGAHVTIPNGEAQGIPIAAGYIDGYDELDAQEEVWIVGESATSIVLGTTQR